MSDTLMIYGPVKKGMPKPAMAIVSSKRKSEAKAMAKKRNMCLATITDKKILKLLKKNKIPDGWNKDKGFVMVPFTGAEKYIKIVLAAQKEKHIVTNQSGAKLIKILQKKLKDKEDDE